MHSTNTPTSTLTDDKSKIFQLPRTPLILDRIQPFMDKRFSSLARFLVDNNLVVSRVSADPKGGGPRKTYQIHRFRNQPARQTNINGSLLSIARQDPYLSSLNQHLPSEDNDKEQTLIPAICSV